MASQQILFAETIMAMKKALKRKAYESDSDSEIEHHDNRGHKLKKRARFVHEGQLAAPSGPEVYREVVNHAGHKRAIISRNPPLVDEEGYEIDSDDDEGHIQDVANAAAEFNPYANIRLESILAPLTAVTDLPTHPTLSRPYTSKTLTQLTKQACDVMHKENAALWKVKHLQTKLVGDHIWVPCELMLGPNDIELYKDNYLERLGHAKTSVKSDASVLMLENAHNGNEPNGQPRTNGEARPANDGQSSADAPDSADVDADTSMVDAEASVHLDETDPEKSNLREGENDREPVHREGDGKEDPPSEKVEAKTRSKPSEAYGSIDQEKQKQAPPDAVGGSAMNGSLAPSRQDEVDSSVAAQQSHAGQDTQFLNSRPLSLISDLEDDMSIHPLFLPPRSAHPDRDLGIPEGEAEDVRRLLQLYIQKQEEVCRGAKRLYEGLLRADRMRKTVLQWSKYEAHRDLSDGEDWYDKEEWGLDEDLKKGQDEEEEENQQTTKKTRTRR
ncbi:hypothetical protein F5Y15DRAFT_167124 [Xylariaceae sp. FL0016]|nr:hypothetical protein F5Y15DRAFT_167124 [Xylariaceae sp. FL0016]